MLPFLKNQKEASGGSNSEPVMRKPDEEQAPDFLETVMDELFSAKTGKERAQAFRAAFSLLEQEPHEEVEHG